MIMQRHIHEFDWLAENSGRMAELPVGLGRKLVMRAKARRQGRTPAPVPLPAPRLTLHLVLVEA